MSCRSQSYSLRGLVGVLGQSYDVHVRDRRGSGTVGTVLDLRDPGFFAYPCPLQRLVKCYPTLNLAVTVR